MVFFHTLWQGLEWSMKLANAGDNIYRERVEQIGESHAQAKSEIGPFEG